MSVLIEFDWLSSRLRNRALRNARLECRPPREAGFQSVKVTDHDLGGKALRDS